MKPIISLLIIAIALTLFTSCSSEAYSDGISCYELSLTALGDDTNEFAYYKDDYLDLFFGGTTLCDDFEIVYSREVNDVDELGIFHLTSGEDIDSLTALAQDYLAEMREGKSAFIGSYAPLELPKLEDAEVKVFGNYVVYAIMDSEDRAEMFRRIEKYLKRA